MTATARLRTAITLAAIVGFSACKKTPVLGFDVVLPSDVASNVAWVEVGVFEGTTCDALGPQLAGGVPASGAVRRVAFRADDVTPPGLGNLPRARYAFAAVAKGQDCAVLAAGCTSVDVHDDKTITIDAGAVTGGAGACSSDATCSEARCVPAGGPSTTTTVCSLDFVGAGPLGDPLLPSGTVVSVPAIAPTPQGFVLAYREYDPFGGSARFTTLPIEAGGGAGTPTRTTLPSCAGIDATDATGLAFAGSTGIAAVARPACGGTAAIDLLALDATGAITRRAAVGSGASPLTLAAGHALASTSNGAGFLLAFTQDQVGRIGIGSGIAVTASASPFDGQGPLDATWVAASDQSVALLGRVASNAPATPDAGDEAGAPTASSGLLFQMVAAGASLEALGTPVSFGGSWGALSVARQRAYVVTDSTNPGMPVLFRAFDLGRRDPTVTDGFTTPGPAPVLAADVAVRGDELLFAVERPGAINVVAYTHAATTPAYLRQVPLAGDPRIPSLAAVRDGRVAIAASASRVAVAWTTGKALGTSDAVGGYAIFDCAPSTQAAAVLRAPAP